MNTKAQLICTWSGMVFSLMFLVGFWPIANFMPPLAPSLPAAEVAAAYQEHTLPIRFGLLMMMTSAGFICPFVAVIAVQMKRIEGSHPALTITQISTGTLNAVFFVVPSVIWTVTAFRPERDPELLLLMNDFGWITFLMPFTTFIVQNFSIGLSILSDKREQPVFPRWLGFFNFWVAVLFIPGGLLTFFKTGPFAWNGLFVWWIPFIVFFAWYMLMFYMLRAAVIAQADDTAAMAAAT